MPNPVGLEVYIYCIMSYAGKRSHKLKKLCIGLLIFKILIYLRIKYEYHTNNFGTNVSIYTTVSLFNNYYKLKIKTEDIKVLLQ